MTCMMKTASIVLQKNKIYFMAQETILGLLCNCGLSMWDVNCMLGYVLKVTAS